MYKVLILKNKISKSLKPKLNNVKKWFSPVIDLEFTEEETNFDIINGDYTLPTSTVANKTLTVKFIYDSVTSKFGCIYSIQEA